MQSVMNLVWDKLLPAIKSSPLAANLESQTKLSQTLKALTLRPQVGSGSPQKEILGKTFVFASNDHKLESLILEQDDKEKSVAVVTRFDGIDYRTTCRNGQWTMGKSGWSTLREQPIASSGAWTTDDTYTARICFYETPFVVTASFKFVGNEVHYLAKTNVGFGPKNEFQLVGTSSVNSQK